MLSLSGTPPAFAVCLQLREGLGFGFLHLSRAKPDPRPGPAGGRCLGMDSL